MDKKLGVYICSGCGVGDSLDVDKLAKIATSEYKAPVCRVHPCLCGDEGLGQIRSDISAGTVTTLVIAGCSPRAKTGRFSFDSSVLFDRVNLREQVAWSHPPKHEDTQMLAEDCLRMGMVKSLKMDAVEPVCEILSRSILVVGGGVTGISAALAAANAGYNVLLVEKEPQLGGFLAGLKETFPTHAPYTEAESGGLTGRIQALTSHSLVNVFCSTIVSRVEGQPGMFQVTLQNGSHSSVHRVGAIIMATGWKPYDPAKLSTLGYGLPDVVTSVDLEKTAAAGPITQPSTGKPVESVLFIQCAGSRSKEHLPYCSSVCCMNTLKQIGYVREQNPQAKVFVVYRDMMTPGQYEKYYQQVQDHPLNFFMKGEISEVAKNGNGTTAVTVDSALLGTSVRVEADLVVLATGMVPNAADGEAIRTLHDAQLKVLRNESDTQRQEAEATVEEFRRHENTEILNLAYRQGPDLPVRPYGFPDSHFVCFPYETRRTGIYTAGTVRAPMDSAMAEEDAAGAAMKAIQCIELSVRGEAVHPRAGDLSYPIFSLQRCTQCKRCTEECPFGTLDEDEKGTPKFNVYRCRRCGICMGACPERIISFKNYSVDMIASMIKAIEVPDETEDKPRIVVFACENDAYPALDLAGWNRAPYDASVRVIPLRCLGSLNIVWIADALSRGIDGVLLIGCKFGDDYQCHFVRGSELANRRLDNVKETLQRLQLEPERVQLAQVSIDEYGRLPQMINEFAERIRKIGPNPYKGF